MGKVKLAVGDGFRHGDVYILKTSLSRAEIRTGKRVMSPVLAFGEKTGHQHALMEDTGTFERYELGGKTYLIVGEGGISITHEEHGVGVIDAGVYEVPIDREWDYLGEMSRQVVD